MRRPPADARAERGQILREGGRFLSLHNNCSGKHTFIRAATCGARQGWAPDYRDPEHPLQRRVADDHRSERCPRRARDRRL
ncbi:MAG: asparaginase [Polyangiales bacterium]